MNFHKSNKQIIRNIIIPQLYKFLKNTSSIELSDNKLIHIHNWTVL